MKRLLALASAAACLCACNAPDPPSDTGGVHLEPGACGRGITVASTDYQSTTIAVLDARGAPASASIISSASAEAALSAPLSGDVALPTTTLDGDDLVLIDRYPASVLTFVDLPSGTVRAQLDVSTGFASNPQDYLRVADDRAYVTRFETNASPGAEPFDAGGDVLIIDPRAPAITGRIDLAEAVADAPGFLPRANRMVRVGSTVFVLLSAYAPDFSDSAPSRLVAIDSASDSIGAVVVLTGLHGCAGLALAPDHRIAVACSGKFGGASTPTLDESGLVVLGADSVPVELERHMAADLGERPLGFSTAFTPAGGLLVTALGAFGSGGAPDIPDALLFVDSAASGEVTRSAKPFGLGDVRCLLGTPARADCEACFVADADAGAIQHLSADGRDVADSIRVDDGIGLPPRLLGGL